MAYATDEDLQAYADDVFRHGVSSFADELTLASNDVLNLIKSEWWPAASQGRMS